MHGSPRRHREGEEKEGKEIGSVSEGRDCALTCSCGCGNRKPVSSVGPTGRDCALYVLLLLRQQETCELHGANRKALSPSDSSSGKDQKSRKTGAL